MDHAPLAKSTERFVSATAPQSCLLLAYSSYLLANYLTAGFSAVPSLSSLFDNEVEDALTDNL